MQRNQLCWSVNPKEIELKGQNSIERTKLRNTLLSNGYRPLPLAKKGVFIRGWSRAEITEDWLKPYARVGRYNNTGLRCDDLLAFDIDVTLDDLAGECEAYVESHAGNTDLCRVGQWPKRLLLYRLDPHASDLIRSGRTGKYGGHMVELLATHGRQFAAFGIHPGTGKPYSWIDGFSPLTVAYDELPMLSAPKALEVMEGLDKLLANTGLERERRAHVHSGGGLDEFDLLLTTKVMYEGEIVLWGDLAAVLTSEGGFGNFWRAEYDQWGDSDAIHYYLAHGSNEPCAHDFINDCTHWTSLYNPEFAQLLPPPPGDKRDNDFVPKDMSDMIENCVMLRDKTVRRLDHPMRVYPLDGFIRSMQHLRVPDPNPPPSNPNKTIPFTRLWEQDVTTLKADYAAMRPDCPDDDIITKGSERVMNTYLPPAHPDLGGQANTFWEFIGHLLPAKAEQDIFLSWLAHKVQNPGDRMHGMVMVTPAYGTGRGTLVQIMQRLFGIEYVNEVELSDLIGTGGQSQFNSYLADSLMVTVSEALEEREDISKWAARHVAYERLKMVCDPVSQKMHVRRKYGRNSSEQIFASLFISSNHTDALAIESGDRRLIVLDNGELPLSNAKGDLYKRIHEWKDSAENIGKLYRVLMGRASEYNAFGEPPMTPAKERMIDAGQSDVDRLFEIFVDQAKGDLATAAQWRHFAHTARMQYDLDLPADPTRRDNALSVVMRQHCRRIDTLAKAGLKVKGRPVRPWIIRNFTRWKGSSSDLDAIRAEILRNGDPGGMVVELPPKAAR